jgi:hypothetical protein
MPLRDVYERTFDEGVLLAHYHTDERHTAEQNDDRAVPKAGDRADPTDPIDPIDPIEGPS